MAYREVRVYEVREVLRLWLRGEGYRSLERLVGLDRKTVRRYVEAARAAGLEQDAGEQALSEELIGAVIEAVRPHRGDGHGAAWARLVAEHEQINRWLVKQELNVVKVHELLARRGVSVPERTLHRYAREVCGVGRRSRTLRLADGAPGDELQIDFGRLGLIFDPPSGRRRALWALIFTPVLSRYSFVWLTFRQTLADVIEGHEAAWAFYGGVFATLIPDNLKAIVEQADALEPRLNQAFVEYAQARGFVVDPARVRSPLDKARVERVVPFVRGSFFAGESFIDLPDAQRRVERWARERAGMRIHGTIQARPAEVFASEEAARLGPAPTEPYDLPIYRSAKVHPDHHIEVAKALYSVPGDLIGQRVDVRADRSLVRIFAAGRLVKVHPRQEPGRRVSDVADLPKERSRYALRDIGELCARAEAHGPSVGAYATALLDGPLPWTKMRQVYALLGLVKKWGPARVDAACGRALEAEALNVGLIGRMLERARESAEDPGPAAPTSPPAAGAGRFARDPEHFATTAQRRPGERPGERAEGVAPPAPEGAGTAQGEGSR